MAAIAASGTNRISAANERQFKQSNLLGDWKGEFAKTKSPIGFKVVSIKGANAEIEYTHNGRTERGVGTVKGNAINYGAVTLITRDGKIAAFEFSSGRIKEAALLAKAEPPKVEPDKMVGTWGGYSADTGQNIAFRVLSTNGRDAQVKVTINGVSQEGTGTIFKNSVMFNRMQVSSDDGKNGTVVLAFGLRSVPVPVTKYPSQTSSSVDRLA